VVVAVAFVRMMKAAVYEVVRMVAVRDRLMAAIRPVGVRVARRGRAIDRVRLAHRDGGFIKVISMRRVKVAVMDVGDIDAYPNGGMAAAFAMNVRMAAVDLVRWLHLLFPLHNKGVAKRKKPSKVPKKRNIAAALAKNQKAGAMKDRRTERGGAKNTMREDLTEAER